MKKTPVQSRPALTTLLAQLADAEGQRLPTDANGRHYARIEIGNGPGQYHANIRRTAGSHGLMLVAVATGVAHVYSSVTGGVLVPARLGDVSAHQINGQWLRETKADPKQLTHLARWLAKHWRYGLKVLVERDEGTTEFTMPVIRAEQSDAEYWESVAAHFADQHFFTRIHVGNLYYTLPLPKLAPLPPRLLVPEPAARYAW